jgi:alkanesulfonate monooxygenase SsuD/methylene tetrahydromethanopterin reductase-like flavin-dependent oxidoreductase (luciferase family)
VALDNVALVAAPSHPPLVSLGVQGPKGLALAGRIADGVILGEGATPAATAAARVAIGREARLTVFVVATQSADAAMRHIVTEGFCGSPPPPIEELALTGHPSTWRRQSDVWLAAGADTVVCCGVPDDPADVPDGLS